MTTVLDVQFLLLLHIETLGFTHKKEEVESWNYLEQAKNVQDDIQATFTIDHVGGETWLESHGEHEREKSEAHCDFIYHNFCNIDEQTGALSRLIHCNKTAKAKKYKLSLIQVNEVPRYNKDGTHKEMSSNKYWSSWKQLNGIIRGNCTHNICKPDNIGVLLCCVLIDLSMVVKVEVIELFKNKNDEAVYEANSWHYVGYSNPNGHPCRFSKIFIG